MVLDHPNPVPVEIVRRILLGFKSKVVVLLADENCCVDQGGAITSHAMCTVAQSQIWSAQTVTV